ncbi:MAG: hypothetical protein IPM18_06080 [Phycisphaerales bacterium]|nr:hypothetical protein [Phycisphaerales bacterium]
MESSPHIWEPVPGAPAAGSPLTGSHASRFRWLNRSRRILLLLSAIWVISIFDLAFTLNEYGTEKFVELNPVADRVLAGPVHHVMLYKFGLLGVGTLILLALRRHTVAELACWFLFTFKVYVGVRWFAYYDCLLYDYVNPFIRVVVQDD